MHTGIGHLRSFRHVYLHINPKKSTLRIGSCAKLAHQFCGPFKFLERIGPIAYRLALPLTMKLNDVFHVNKYVKDVDHVIDSSVLQVEPDGEFQSETQYIAEKVFML